MKQFKHLGLSTRIIGHLALILSLTIAIGASAIWYAVSFQHTINDLIRHNMESLQAAREIETALANQKGFVTYYFLDGDPKWLQELTIYRKAFKNWLKKASAAETDPSHLELLDQINDRYRVYIQKKDYVIDLYKSGQRESGEQLHWEVRANFSDLNDLTTKYKKLKELSIENIREESRQQSANISSLVIASMIVAVVLGVFLGFLLMVQVIGPIRRLAELAPETDEPENPSNEVTVLSNRVRGLMGDIHRARNELQQSKTLLLNSEKMALVGKLATEVAHSIRNPMTSINMRLFSLKRNLEMTPNQEEDLEVVAEEMHRLDNIVRNFLEFSRPHKLRKQMIDIADTIDMAVNLLEYRLRRHAVELIHEKPDTLPLVEADPELIKEVFVNLIVNACEAMTSEGQIIISEQEIMEEGIGRAVRIRVRDTGPGIAEDAMDKVFEPFHTTKPDGTGIGLFIVTRIVMEHGGLVELEPEAGDRGAVFNIVLPAAKDEKDQES